MWDKPLALNWLANLLYALAAVLFVYLLFYVLVHLPIFPLRLIKVEGELHHVTHEQVSLIVSRYLQGNFFTLDLSKTRDAFRKLPWARKVSVRRRWPDRLEVRIEEHQALARWGDIALVNTHGELFHAASDKDLPIFFGPGDGIKEISLQYDSYQRLLSQAGMQLVEVSLTPRRAWQLKTEQGLVIALGRDNPDARLDRFCKVIQRYRQILDTESATAQFPQARYVDLRYSNGFAVRKSLLTTASSASKDTQKHALMKLTR